MAEMSLEVQKQRILEVKQFLNDIIRITNYQKDEFANHLDCALELGMPVEIYNMYKNHYLNSLNNDLDNLMSRIQRDDMVYLNQVQVHIQEAINK